MHAPSYNLMTLARAHAIFCLCTVVVVVRVVYVCERFIIYVHTCKEQASAFLYFDKDCVEETFS